MAVLMSIALMVSGTFFCNDAVIIVYVAHACAFVLHAIDVRTIAVTTRGMSYKGFALSWYVILDCIMTYWFAGREVVEVVETKVIERVASV